jgi:hypothetical protein
VLQISRRREERRNVERGVDRSRARDRRREVPDGEGAESSESEKVRSFSNEEGERRVEDESGHQPARRDRVSQTFNELQSKRSRELTFFLLATT